MGERFPSAEAFYEIIKRGSGSAADDHLHAVIEFCGLLADGGPRCGAPVGSFYVFHEQPNHRSNPPH